MSTPPVILVHGIARFDWAHEHYRALFPHEVQQATDRSHYFRGIQSYLSSHGFSVHHVSLGYAQRSAERAATLGEQIKKILATTGAPQVHLIGHSMGGLDARRLIIEQAELAARIASLTTIGTPHLGTALADWGFEHGASHIISAAKPLLDLSGFTDLTRLACREFNRQSEALEAANSVRYRVCASHASRKDTLLPMRPAWDIVFENEGDNDGLVSVASQLWANELRGSEGRIKRIEQISFSFPADHFNQTGWWDPSKRDRQRSLLDMRESIGHFEDQIRQMYLELVRGAVHLGAKE